MKKLMGILLAASMVFSLAACGSTADTAASSAAGTTATAEGSSNNQAPDVKVGAIILGDETEGYSAAHINGIKEAAAELGMSDDQIVWKYKIAEGGVTADAAEDLVGQGCNLIISNSYGHQTYMEEEAEKYPDINFVAMTGDFAATQCGRRHGSPRTSTHSWAASTSSTFAARSIASPSWGCRTPRRWRRSRTTRRNWPKVTGRSSWSWPMPCSP